MPFIASYLEQHGADGFRELTSIFRHDYVQFLGMLQSWMALIEAEIATTPVEAYRDAASAQTFRRAAAYLQHKVDFLFNDSRARLHPALTSAPLLEQWETFFSEFRAYALPRLERLERATRTLIAFPTFTDVIEKSFSGAADGESIKDLILKPYSRLRDIMDIEAFDARVADLTQDNNARV
jgi:hypothetical protein